MSVRSELDKVYKIFKREELGKLMGVSYQAIGRWYAKNRMPDSDYSGRTKHSKTLEKITGGKVTVKRLLGWEPPANFK